MSLMRPLSSIQDLNRIFYDLEREFFSPSTRRTGEGGENLMQTIWAPPVDIVEEPNEIIVKAQVPGIGQEDIDVEVENNLLTIRGEVKRTDEEKKQNFHRREIIEGSFYRQIQLPSEVEADKANARFENGILIVNIPKSRQTSRHKIKVGR